MKALSVEIDLCEAADHFGTYRVPSRKGWKDEQEISEMPWWP